MVWAVLYQREVIDLNSFLVRTSYPILPWIGVIALGFLAGPLFRDAVPTAERQTKMFTFGSVGLLLFVFIRLLNFYGDSLWIDTNELSTTLMSFLSLTKYPPSLLFNLSMLSLGLIFLALFEKFEHTKFALVMSQFGAAPMFFYAFHLALLKLLYVVAYSLYGPSEGIYLAFPSVGYIWITFAGLTFVTYFPTRWFAEYKQVNIHIRWLKYF